MKVLPKISGRIIIGTTSHISVFGGSPYEMCHESYLLAQVPKHGLHVCNWAIDP